MPFDGAWWWLFRPRAKHCWEACTHCTTISVKQHLAKFSIDFCYRVSSHYAYKTQLLYLRVKVKRPASPRCRLYIPDPHASLLPCVHLWWLNLPTKNAVFWSTNRLLSVESTTFPDNKDRLDRKDTVPWPIYIYLYMQNELWCAECKQTHPHKCM